MKVAFVVGFFNTVEDALRSEMKERVDAKSIVCVPKRSSQYPFDLNRFKWLLSQELKSSDDEPILVVASDLRAEERFNHDLKQIIEAQRIRSGRDIRRVTHKDAQDPAPVFESLEEFGFSTSEESSAEEISESTLTAHRGGKKILCVRGPNQSAYEDTLRRANFKFERFEDHFEEMVLPYSSNNGHTLKQSAKSHSCLIYAWGELKYLQPTVADKWQNLHQGKNPAAAIGRFKQSVGVSKRR